MGSTDLWERMSNGQLQGAHATLRLAHTSPRFRGAALALLDELIEEVSIEMRSRPKSDGTDTDSSGNRRRKGFKLLHVPKAASGMAELGKGRGE